MEETGIPGENHQKKEMPVAAMFVNGSERSE
jgi:hypothetical protein